MGISGLLPQLKSITKRVHLSEHAGARAAVDAYSLLHKGSYACARELVEDIPTTRHVEYCMTRINELITAGIRPVLVFDGGRLPSKTLEEGSRHSSRAVARERARALDAAGNASGAYEAYQRAVDVKPFHAFQLILALRQKGIPYVVAPYEADAQMAFLALTNQVELVISEDSDMLAYGCPIVMFKVDRGGWADEVRLINLQHNVALSFKGWEHDLFQQLCIMSGCDFLPSLPGIGIKRAYAQLKKTRCFIKAVQTLKWAGTSIPQDYLARFQRALWVFQYQRVYCAQSGKTRPLHEFPEGGLSTGARVPEAATLQDSELDFLGPELDDDVAQKIAQGMICPITREGFQVPATLDPIPRAPAQPRGHGSGHHHQPTNSWMMRHTIEKQAVSRTWAVPATTTSGQSGAVLNKHARQTNNAPRPSTNVDGPNPGQPQQKGIRTFYSQPPMRPLPATAEAQRAFRPPRRNSTQKQGQGLASVVNGKSRHFLGESAKEAQNSRPSPRNRLSDGGDGGTPTPNSQSSGNKKTREIASLSPSETALSPGLARALKMVKQRRDSGGSQLADTSQRIEPSQDATSSYSQGAIASIRGPTSWGVRVVPSQGSSQEEGGRENAAKNKSDLAYSSPASTPLRPKNTNDTDCLLPSSTVRKKKKSKATPSSSAKRAQKRAPSQQLPKTFHPPNFAEFAFVA